MKLLAFELATEACSVALWIDGDVCERFELAPRRHAELALPWAGQLLAQAGIAKSQLDAIAVGRGPGAFTGVRLAVALAQGIALALDRPIVPVSTLAALAMQAAAAGFAQDEDAIDGRQGPPHLRTAGSGEPDAGRRVDRAPRPAVKRVLASIDARMGEVYAGAFELRDGDTCALSKEMVMAPGAVPMIDRAVHWYGVGTGFAASGGALAQRLSAQFVTIDATALPHAACIARLAALAYARGETIAADLIEPAYLRNNVALTMAEQQQLRDSRP